jgi:nitroreductase
MLKELIQKNRSYRRFYQDVKIEHSVLEELVGLARLSSTGSNMQPLKFLLSCQPQKNAQIFEHLRWASYLPEWSGPQEGEKPAAYIVILGDKNIKTGFGIDHGIAAQSIMLGAVEKGFGGCMIMGFDKARHKEVLGLSEQYEPLLVLALGKPKETVILDDIGEDGSVKYWRDENQAHHVPKRKFEDLILSD